MRHNLALLLLAALIVPGPALADACDDLAARVVQATGTQVKARRTHVFDLTWDDNQIGMLTCDHWRRGDRGVLMTWVGMSPMPPPPPSFFEALGRLAEIGIDVSAAQVANTARACWEKVKRAKDDAATLEALPVTVRCTRFVGAKTFASFSVLNAGDFTRKR